MLSSRPKIMYDKMIYEPLDRSVDCLRLLKILPVVNRDLQIYCELETRTFTSKPSYQALSYTWGAGSASEMIYINGQPFLVRENLHNALVHLRNQNEPRHVWVDAICINQHDLLERNYQVSIMTFIYTRAHRVIVWLGDSPYALPSTSVSNRLWNRGKFDYENGLAVATHPYWTRMWIVQELVLAQDVVFCYGGWEFTWEILSSVIDGEPADVLKKTAHSIMKQRAIRHSNEHRLEKLLQTFQSALCSEPRDKIFGLLGMAHDCDSDVLEVNYEMPYVELYSNMVKLHKSMPSVFPTESPLAFIDRPLMLMRFSRLVQRTLGGLVEEEAEITEPSKWPKYLHEARGALAGVILHLGPTYTETVSSLRANRTWKKAYEACYQDGIDRVREEDEAYSKAILEWDEKHLKTIRAVYTNTSYGYRVRCDDDLVNNFQETHSKPDVSEPRRFLATGVLLGFAPPEARVGDLICRFWDCDVAVVVRRIGDEDTDRWMIVGKADISTTVRRPEDYDDQNAMRYDMGRFNEFPGETELDKVRFALKSMNTDFRNVINFRLDTETLQKLTS